MNSTLIILGAGCSFNSGYPPASNSFPRLAAFRDSLGDDATKLRRFVTQTLDLVEKLRKQGESVETLDTFSRHRFAGVRAQESDRWRVTCDMWHEFRRLMNGAKATEGKPVGLASL